MIIGGVWTCGRADGVKLTVRNVIQMLHVSSVAEMSEVFSVGSSCSKLLLRVYLASL